MLRGRYEIIWVFACAAIASVAYALHQGQDANWDQLNYHYYDVFALFHDRSLLDVAAAQRQSWLNPFGEILQYFLVMLPPRLATAALALIASASVTLVYFVAKASLSEEKTGSPVGPIFVGAIAAVSAFAAPLFLSELGTTFDDYLSSIFIFLALLFVVQQRFSLRAYLLAGFLLGLALGIKLTNAIFIFGWIAATLTVARLRFFKPLLASGLAALATYLPIGGAWNWHLYALTGNPIFPFYNNLFRSPAYAPVSLLDERFRAGSLMAALREFPEWALGLHPSAEAYFRDARFLLVLLLLLLAFPLVLRLVAKPRDFEATAPFRGDASAFLLVFAIVSFVAWLWFYGIERYAIPLEQMAGLLILILLALLTGPGWRFRGAAIMSCAAILFTTAPADWGHATFRGSWFEIKLPAELTRPNVLFVMLSDEGFSYVIPAFPTTDSFVRIDGNLPLSPLTGLGRQALAMIRAHEGEIRSLSLANFSSSSALTKLAEFGLTPTSGPCLAIATKARALKSCPLGRMKP